MAQQPNKLWLEVGMEDVIVIRLSFHLRGFSVWVVAVGIDDPASLEFGHHVLFVRSTDKQLSKGSAADSGLSI